MDKKKLKEEYVKKNLQKYINYGKEILDILGDEDFTVIIDILGYVIASSVCQRAIDPKEVFDNLYIDFIGFLNTETIQEIIIERNKINGR